MKVTMIGAGSVVFSKNLTGDILSFPEFKNIEIALMDIDSDRLSVAEAMVNRVVDYLGAKPVVKTYSDRKAALDGADYVINMIQVGGYDPGTITDFEIPKKYGLKQTIADTLGIGGVFRSLRTIPVMLDMCRDMEKVCPDVWFLNYVNPMAMNTGAVLKATKIKTVGLCHGIQGSQNWIAQCLGIPKEEIRFRSAGINHLSFILTMEHNGVDLYPKLKQLAEEGGECVDKDKVRFEMLRKFGYYGGESSEHTAEYVPYFIRRDREDLIEKFNVPIDEYIRRCKEQIKWWEDMRDKLLSGEEPLEVSRTEEYGSYIIHSIETGTPRVIYGNVLNNGHITNLPDRCCVEVPCLVDRNGIQPTYIGDLPPQLAALIRTNVNVQELTIEAVLTGKKEYVYHAAMLDPHTSAELTMDEIHNMVDDLFEAHDGWIPPMN
ncbi:MAG: alpha-glucosidase/alpha-galactosidase [Armatimonadota bacterium]